MIGDRLGGRSCSRRVSTADPVHCNLDDRPHIRSRFLSICQRLGMIEIAVDAWEMLHKPAEPAIVVSFSVKLAIMSLLALLCT